MPGRALGRHDIRLAFKNPPHFICLVDILYSFPGISFGQKIFQSVDQTYGFSVNIPLISKNAKELRKMSFFVNRLSFLPPSSILETVPLILRKEIVFLIRHVFARPSCYNTILYLIEKSSKQPLLSSLMSQDSI